MSTDTEDAAIEFGSLGMRNITDGNPEKNILRFEFDASGVAPIEVAGTHTGDYEPHTNFSHWVHGGNANLGAGWLDLVDLGDAVPGTHYSASQFCLLFLSNRNPDRTKQA